MNATILDKTFIERDTDTDDPDKISKKLIENIHKLLGPTATITIAVILTLIYLAIFFSIMRNKNKPHIQSRSPILMLIITFGVYFDTILKLMIISTEYQRIDVKCQMAIAARVVFYYIAFIFILIRIQRVHSVNKLNEELTKGTEETNQGEKQTKKNNSIKAQ